MSLTSGLFDTVHDWLSRLRGFFNPRSLEVSVTVGANGERLFLEFGELPRVVWVTDKALRQWDPQAPSIEELGYTAYDKDFSMRATYYARRPWVWLLKAHVRIMRELWRVLSWADGKVWYFKRTAFSQPRRWRDVRLGSGVLNEERLASAHLVERVHKLQAEVEKLAADKRGLYVNGMKDGWDQFAHAMKNQLGGWMTSEEAVARLKPKEESDDMQKTKD